MLTLGLGVAFSIHRIAQQSRLAEQFKTLDVEVVADDYRLYFRYPGEDQLLHTQDDRQGVQHLYVPADAKVRLGLNSRDYIYLIEIPAARLYEVAAPELQFDVQFDAPSGGRHQLLGSQMCGYDHPELLGELIVQSPTDFRRTMNRLSSTPLRASP